MIKLKDIINEIINEIENTPICQKCGGVCCKSYPGITSPEDWGAPNKPAMLVQIRQALQSGNYVLDYWDGDPRPGHQNIDKWEYSVVFFPRPAHAGNWRTQIMKRGYYKPCVFQQPTGCKLSHDERPRQCRDLEPIIKKGQGFACKEGWPKQEAAISWIPYQDIMNILDHEGYYRTSD